MSALVIVALASYRLTRLVVLDDVSERPRRRMLLWLARRRPATPLIALPGTAALFGCVWCAGFWVSGIVVGLAALAGLIPGGWALPFEWAAVATVVGLIGQVEP